MLIALWNWEHSPIGLIELASEGYSVVLGDLPSTQEMLRLASQECVNIQCTLSNAPSLRSLYMACDVSVEEQVKELVDTAVNELGGLDVVCLNAIKPVSSDTNPRE